MALAAVAGLEIVDAHERRSTRDPEISDSDLDLILDALDSHEYWQLGDGLPRNNGMVWSPGDAVEVTDRYWGTEAPTGEVREAIRAVERCRDLADQLRAQR